MYFGWQEKAFLVLIGVGAAIIILLILLAFFVDYLGEVLPDLFLNLLDEIIHGRQKREEEERRRREEEEEARRRALERERAARESERARAAERERREAEKRDRMLHPENYRRCFECKYCYPEVEDHINLLWCKKTSSYVTYRKEGYCSYFKKDH